MANAEIAHVAWSAPAEERAGTPLVVALHGRGADETSMLGLRAYLRAGVTVAALRAPILEGGGYAWFANRGIGRPIEESIKDTGAAVFEWLDGVAAAHSQVIIVGFSGGTAMAGGLVWTAPERFAGAVLLSGTLPWDAGYDSSPGRLNGLPVFWANDVADAVIPRGLVERSEAWLRTDSGAALEERHYVGLGHSISAVELDDIRAFLDGLL